MHTKYRVSVEDTYIGPINSVPDSLLEEPADKSTLSSDSNNNQMVYSNLNYECRMRTPTVGRIQLYAGHHKHMFSTCDRSIACLVVKGQMKVKSGSRKWTVTDRTGSDTIKLDPNSTYFVKNNSLQSECVIIFEFVPN